MTYFGKEDENGGYGGLVSEPSTTLHPTLHFIVLKTDASEPCLTNGTMSDARTALVKFLFGLLYEVKPTLPRSKCVSSYALKHVFENAIFHGYNGRFYFSNTETKEALRHSVPHFARATAGGEVGPNLFFKVKPKFPLMWITKPHPLTNRPYGERKDKWALYTQAREQLNQFLSEVIAATHGHEGFYAKMTALVGHEGNALTTVPLCLARRVPDVDYTPQQINELQEEIHHAWEGREEEWAARHGPTEPQETGDPVSPSAPALTASA